LLSKPLLTIATLVSRAPPHHRHRVLRLVRLASRAGVHLIGERHEVVELAGRVDLARVRAHQVRLVAEDALVAVELVGGAHTLQLHGGERRVGRGGRVVGGEAPLLALGELGLVQAAPAAQVLEDGLGGARRVHVADVVVGEGVGRDRCQQQGQQQPEETCHFDAHVLSQF